MDIDTYLTIKDIIIPVSIGFGMGLGVIIGYHTLKYFKHGKIEKQIKKYMTQKQRKLESETLKQKLAIRNRSRKQDNQFDEILSEISSLPTKEPTKKDLKKEDLEEML